MTPGNLKPPNPTRVVFFFLIIICVLYFLSYIFFHQAAASYRAAGEENQAVAMYMTAGECQSHESVMAPASAAKDFKEAALITERQGR